MDMTKRRPMIYGMGLIISALLLLQGAGIALAAEDAKPERLLSMAVEYPGVELDAPDDVDMNITFYNKGRSDETVDVWLAEAPEGWATRLKTYKFTVTGVHVPAGKDKALTFEADPDDDLEPGRYQFRVAAKTRDGRFEMDETIVVTIKGKKETEVKTSKELKLSTTYPVLRGPTDGSFEFSVELDSDLDTDSVIDLAAEGPKDWTINFKPGYESKYITSLQMKANQSRNISVEVKPAFNAEAGEYPIKMRAATEGKKAEIDLTVALTGTYKLEAGTPTGRLSLEAKPGKTANLSIYVKNTGSAVNRDIEFMSFKPENWKVEFEPEKIATLAPGALEQVEVSITPYEDALVGDYSVSVNVQGERASKTLEFRTTVKASAMWSWVGVVVIAGVIGGLTGLFQKFGRR